jgi:hypothetical protein
MASNAEHRRWAEEILESSKDEGLTGWERRQEIERAHVHAILSLGKDSVR